MPTQDPVLVDRLLHDIGKHSHRVVEQAAGVRDVIDEPGPVADRLLLLEDPRTDAHPSLRDGEGDPCLPVWPSVYG